MRKLQLNQLFTMFAKKVSYIMGSSWCFIIACSFILTWGILGPIFRFSDTWQLFINTVTSIITFLMVFIIQNTQNRDTQIIKLKLDELIKATDKADNQFIDLEQLSDGQLKNLEVEYKKLSKSIN